MGPIAPVLFVGKSVDDSESAKGGLVSKNPALDRIDEGIAQMRFRERAIQNAFLEATGFAADDPESPQPEIMALWRNNRLEGLQVEDSVIEEYMARGIRQPGDSEEQARQRMFNALFEFNALVNGVILASRADWTSDVASRMPQ